MSDPGTGDEVDPEVHGDDRQSPNDVAGAAGGRIGGQSRGGRVSGGGAEVRTVGASTVGEAGSRYTSLWWAKVQSAGPLLVSPDTPAVAGLTRAAEPDGRHVWMLPSLPDGAGHGVLDELGTPPVAVEQPNETARVLAICLTCCWPDRSGPAWPGVPATLAQVKAVYAGFRGRAEQSSDLTLIIGSLRRLHATSWLIWDEKVGEVRLGPRVIGWGPGQLAGLREVCRILPDPPPTASARPTPTTPLPSTSPSLSNTPSPSAAPGPSTPPTWSAPSTESARPLQAPVVPSQPAETLQAPGAPSQPAEKVDSRVADRRSDPEPEEPVGPLADEGGQLSDSASYGLESEVDE